MEKAITLKVSMNTTTSLAARNINKVFPSGKGRTFQAVTDLSFELKQGESLSSRRSYPRECGSVSNDIKPPVMFLHGDFDGFDCALPFV